MRKRSQTETQKEIAGIEEYDTAHSGSLLAVKTHFSKTQGVKSADLLSGLQLFFQMNLLKSARFG